MYKYIYVHVYIIYTHIYIYIYIHHLRTHHCTHHSAYICVCSYTSTRVYIYVYLMRCIGGWVLSAGRMNMCECASETLSSGGRFHWRPPAAVPPRSKLVCLSSGSIYGHPHALATWPAQAHSCLLTDALS